jgi:hypothetical protein
MEIGRAGLATLQKKATIAFETAGHNVSKRRRVCSKAVRKQQRHTASIRNAGERLGRFCGTCAGPADEVDRVSPWQATRIEEPPGTEGVQRYVSSPREM